MHQIELVNYKRANGYKIEKYIKQKVSPDCTNFQMTYCLGTDYSIVTFTLHDEVHVGALIYYDYSEPCFKHRYYV